MRSLFLFTSIVVGLTSLAARADTISTFNIAGTSIFYGLANDTNTVSGTAVIDITSGIVQDVSFTAGGVFESGVYSQQGPIVYVGTDQAKISFDEGSLIGYMGSAFDLNGPNDLYVGHGTMAAIALTPEPGSLVLLATGLTAALTATRRRQPYRHESVGAARN